MVKIYDKENGNLYGTISEEHLQFLIDNLEEESEDDVDYYINTATIEMFEEQGADKTLIDLLKSALGGREDMEIRYEKE